MLPGAFLVCTFLLVMPVRTLADEKTTQEKLDQAREEREDTREAIQDAREDIAALSGQKESLNKRLEDLSGDLTQISSELAGYAARTAEVREKIEESKERIEDKEEEIDQANRDLEEALARQKARYEAMKKRIQFNYEKGQTYILEVLMRSDSFSDLINRRNYLQEVQKYEQESLEEYKENADRIREQKAALEEEKRALEEAQALLQEQKEDLDALQEDTQKKHNEVSGLVQEAAGLVDQTTGELLSAQDAAKAMQDQLEEQNQEISQLEKQLEEEKRLQAISDASQWRDLSQLVIAPDDRYLLANLIWCEAGNQSFEGMVAVGAVVMNRVESGAFPDTISEVIYQKGQFYPFGVGRLALALASGSATPACYEAADAAMSGQSPIGNCLFFRTPTDGVTARYTIGGHIFY